MLSRLTLLCLISVPLACTTGTPPRPPASGRTITANLPEAPAEVADNAWFRQGQDAVATTARSRARPARAKNVILFIGDGMSLDTVTAARILAGQENGATGEENWLNFETLPFTALMKTYTTDLQVPDSAGTATAMLTGVKTKAGVLGVDDAVVFNDCASLALSAVPTFLEQMEAAGKATGIVSTARLTHATPAATYAHAPSRNWEFDGEIPATQTDCRDIARQLVDFDIGDGIEVAMGGGRAGFLPTTSQDPEYPEKTGSRGDGQDLTARWLTRHGAGARYVWNERQFADLDPRTTSKLLALFEPSHMHYEADRQKGAGNEPSLADMTTLAIRLLAANENGYFLLVEGGRIDHAHHAGNASRALHDTLAFDAAIEAARTLIDLDETLLIVTADHGHVLSFSGYPARGNPILGKVITQGLLSPDGPSVATDTEGRPYTTLSYANGPGHRPEGRPDLTDVDTTELDYLQEATFPMTYETHSGTDVIVYADGPGANLFRGVHEQNYVYHVMRHAVGR